MRTEIRKFVKIRYLYKDSTPLFIRFKQLLPYILGLFFLISCGSKTNKIEKREAIARVNDSYLYLDKINDVIPKGTSAKDSLILLKKYINNWIHETLVIQKAEDNLTDEQKNVEKQEKNDFGEVKNKIYIQEFLNLYRIRFYKLYTFKFIFIININFILFIF